MKTFFRFSNNELYIHIKAFGELSFREQNGKILEKISLVYFKWTLANFQFLAAELQRYIIRKRCNMRECAKKFLQICQRNCS